MSRKKVNAVCRAFPGAEVSDPWGGGHDAWKVGGKMFACIGAIMPGVSVKTDSIETAQMLIDAGVGVLLPSLMGQPAAASKDELRHRLASSCRLVRSGLTKKAQAQLDPFERKGLRLRSLAMVKEEGRQQPAAKSASSRT